MTVYAALDVSMEKTAICVVNADGKIALEASTSSDAEAIAMCLEPYCAELDQVGLEAGPLAEWIARGLEYHGMRVVLMETRHVRAALSAMIAKTDRNDARGMAQLLRSGWFRPVHVKTVPAREQRALLAARSTLVRRHRDVENSVRGRSRGSDCASLARCVGAGIMPCARQLPATPCCSQSSIHCPSHARPSGISSPFSTSGSAMWREPITYAGG